MRKVYGKNKWDKQNAVQTIMSMQMYPEFWFTQKAISVPKAVRERLKLGEYASYPELFNAQTGEFKWMKSIQ
jgi:hypothetical protein